MKIRITRQHFLHNCTIGFLEVIFDNNTEQSICLCDTLEPHAIDWSKEQKVYGKTAIPCGEYVCVPRYSAKWKKFMPFLLNVPHFEGIMFHPGSYPKDTMGCILVGHNPRKGNGEVQPKLYNSCAKYKLLKDYIVEAYKKGDNITVEIVEV